MTILDCGHETSPHSPITTGYGTYRDIPGMRYCYACLDQHQEQDMARDGFTMLYLNETERTVTNWTGSLSFRVRHIRRWKGRGFGGSYPVRLAYFIGPDGREWSIKVAGDMDCGTARRLKRRGGK